MTSGKLPINLPLQQMQVNWASILNPLIGSPTASPTLLQNVSLASGSNSVNHLLGQKLTGWYPVRFHGAFAQIYDTQDSNKNPQLTLLLNSSAAVVVDLLVF